MNLQNYTCKGQIHTVDVDLLAIHVADAVCLADDGEHVCATKRDMTGRCFVCGSVQEGQP